MFRIVLVLCLLLPASAAFCGDDIPALDPVAGVATYTGKGRWLVVKIWASDCVICNREAKQYVDFHEFHEDSDATVLGISLDGGNQLAAQGFIKKHEVSYPNLITDYQTGGRWYETMTGERFVGTPAFLIYDPQGNLRARQIGAVPTELIEQFIASNTGES